MTAALATTLTLAAGGALADDYPSKPIRFVIPFGPGSGTDTSARYYAQKVSELAGVPVVVDNRPGGNGFIAVRAVLDAPADGYTLFIGSNSTLATNTALFRQLPYDPIKDFKPIALLLKTPGVLSVPADSGFKTVQDLVEHAKRNPGKLNFAAGSAGYQLMGEYFSQINGIQASHIPFKGAGEAVTAVASGTVDYAFAEVTSSQALVQSGKIRALVVADEGRAASLPDVPSADEAGMPDFKVYTWAAAMVNANTPEDVVRTIEGYFHDVARLPETEVFFEQFGQKPQLGSARDLGDFNVQEIELWNRIVNLANIEKQ
ncbi:tripartite tricarboxylate transporter substrate binding protein [Verticiella sediminum]|uniref:Tripartite tricarboxylate transporter substrate binding protein n=2 Tax=Verticiella sediminum TaxID=1247510 RepID=A0A556AV78_9BURK|nr:tripartite tricarboxylate transporter substrate binding protein [Verticiella sediminum]